MFSFISTVPVVNADKLEAKGIRQLYVDGKVETKDALLSFHFPELLTGIILVTPEILLGQTRDRKYVLATERFVLVSQNIHHISGSYAIDIVKHLEATERDATPYYPPNPILQTVPTELEVCGIDLKTAQVYVSVTAGDDSVVVGRDEEYFFVHIYPDIHGEIQENVYFSPSLIDALTHGIQSMNLDPDMIIAIAASLKENNRSEVVMELEHRIPELA